MSLLFYLFLFIPVAIALFAKFVLKLDISWKEFAAQCVVGILSVSLVWLAGKDSATWDNEIWNGAVTQTDVWRYSCPTNTMNPCRNGYSCNCHQVCSTEYYTDSNGRSQSRQSCHTECDTCYVYPWEQQWLVSTNIHQNRIEIARVDRQGARTPPRWAEIRPGDPVSRPNRYQNWVMAADRSLFNEAPEATTTYADLLVDYPDEIVDYYRIDRVVTPNVRLQNEREWNRQLSNVLSRVGPTQQMNMIIVVTEGTQRDYAFAMRRHWHGFKKNDAVVFIGLNQGNVAWAEVMSWSRNESFNIETRSFFEQNIGQPFASLDPHRTMEQVEELALLFERRPMHEFEYLRGDIPPPTWLLIVAAIISIGGGIGLSYVFHRNEFFEGIYSKYRR